MAYTKQTWANGSGGNTPLSATRLQYIENGIEASDAAHLSSLLWLHRRLDSKSVPAGRTTYFDKADTVFASMPTTMDTAQAITYADGNGTGGTAPSGHLQITSGRLTTNQNASATAGLAAAGYVVIDGQGIGVNRIGIKFDFLAQGRTAHNQAVAIAFANEALTTAKVVSPGTTMRIGVHLVVAETYWELKKGTSASGSMILTQLGIGLLRHPLRTDGTQYEVECWRNGTTATFRLPDGQLVSVTDADIANYAGNYGYVEVITSSASQDIVPGITEAWYDLGTQYPPSSSPYVTRESIDSAGPRVGSVASSATPSIDSSLYDQYEITALAAAITNVTVTGVPTGPKRLMIRIRDNGTARAVTLGSQFRAVGVTLPTTTVISKLLYIGCIYDETDGVWDVLTVAQQA